jgi:hypothetical protein
MEPSAFGYAGLAAQRQNAYDNFLRSNIDNEQDKRNFANEAGRDMLPFRSMEAALTDADASVQNKIGTTNGGAVTTAVNTKFLVPLRWNNPHASELEVNIWISNNKYVVPISKPTCSGEGRQDNVFEFTVPTDFLQLPTKVPGFTGCKAVGDCVVQIYAHSVETRQYAIGTPIIITGDYAANTATDTSAIKPAPVEVGKDISGLRPLCLSAADKQSDIPNAIPQVARLISDVYNHAYQNSDYSPYSGQQPQAISQNLQAAAILSMTTGNRGELGKAALPAAQKALAARLETKQKNLIKQYEGVTNKIIDAIGNQMNNAGQTAALGETGAQKLASTFRGAEVGSVTTTRLKTNTYVPSFQIPQALQAAAKAAVPAKYAGLIDAAGKLQIYVATLKDMTNDFNAAAQQGINYLPAALKETPGTLADATQFKKRTATGARDNGQYATAQAAAAYAVRQAAIIAKSTSTPPSTTAALPAITTDFSNLNANEIPDQPYEQTNLQLDPNAMMSDDKCDNDDIPASSLDLASGQPLPGACSDPKYITFGNEASLVEVDKDGNPISGSANTNTINCLLLSLVSIIASKFIKA